MKQKIVSLVLSAALCAGGLFGTAVVSAAEGLVLTEDSRLTLDRERGIIGGIFGTITADELCAEFDCDASVFSGDDELSGSDSVASGSSVRCGEDSLNVVIYGDVNSDGKINVSDAVAVLKQVAGWQITIDKNAADTNSDGKIGVSDAVAILKWAAGWDIMLGDAVYPAVDMELGDFSIVVPNAASSLESEAAQLLCTALDSIYGTSRGIDRIISDTGSAANEIILGDTSREKSKSAKTDLGEFDWTYDIQSERSVVIVAGDDLGIYEAVRGFLWDSFGYINKYNRLGSYTKWTGSEYIQIEATKTVTAGTKYTYVHESSCENAELNGTDLAEYKLYAPAGDESIAAQIIARGVKKLCGAELSIFDTAEYNGGSAIVFVDPAAKEHASGVKATTFLCTREGGALTVDAMSESAQRFAARALVDKYFSDFTAEESSLTTPESKLYGVDSNLLELTERTDTELDGGATYSELKYTDAYGMDVRAYLTVIPDGASKIVMGTPDGDTISGVSATVLEEMNLVRSSGTEVICGINADFFHIESDNTPQGLCVRNGVILRENLESRPWIAVMKDGTLDCGISGEARAKIKNMQNGFGASHILLKNSIVYQDGQGSSFGEIRHPRSALGYDNDGNVYLIVVDGRQELHSNGASLLDLSLMLRELGVTYAANLDGGGSSTMIVCEDGNLNVKNSPSDGSLRSVYNSVIITK